MYFAFEDRPNEGKIRPVVVSSVTTDQVYFVGIKVTSHAPREWCVGEVVLQDWAEEGLRKPSVVRCTKRASMPTSEVRRVIGHLTQRDVDAVLMGMLEVDG